MPSKGSVGVVETQYFTFAEPPNEMVLEGGSKLGPITLAYETYGTLNADASNAILICHALSGDAHVAGRHKEGETKRGWWDSMVGPGKAFDTNAYFVICSNVLGGCSGSTGPASIDPATGKPYGLGFPVVTIGDMVRAQHALIEHLGIGKLLCVAGGSMGGMQVLDWATRYPDMLASGIVIAASALHSAQQIAFHAVGRHAVQADSGFAGGDYYGQAGPVQGLAIARMLAHITYLSDESMNQKFGRNLRNRSSLGYDMESEFAVETYLDHQGLKFVNRFDANSYLYVTKALDYFDIARHYGTLDEAVARVSSKLMVVSFTSDWLYPPYFSRQIVYAMARQKRDVTYINVKSNKGHDAFLLEFDVLGRIVGGFLRNNMNPQHVCQNCEDRKTAGPAAPPQVIANSIYRGRRIDYDRIVDLVEKGSRVLDIGCGSGELLCRLTQQRNVRGVGLEVNQDSLIEAVECGMSVVQEDIDKGLGALPDQSFDYVILSMTLQVIRKPEMVLREMLRVGKKCIVSFPNFGLWRVRLKTMFLGRAPVTRNLPYLWHQSPNRHTLSIKDFRILCGEMRIHIEREIPLTSEGEVSFWPNLRAEEALYVVRRDDSGEGGTSG